MPLQITGRHTEVTDQQKEYIDKKVNRLRKLCPKIDEMKFTLTREKLHYEVDATFRSGRIVCQATVNDPKPLAAIDMLVDKIESQVRRTKAKRTNKKSGQASKTALVVAEVEKDLENYPDEDLDEEIPEA